MHKKTYEYNLCHTMKVCLFFRLQISSYNFLCNYFSRPHGILTEALYWYVIIKFDCRLTTLFIILQYSCWNEELGYSLLSFDKIASRFSGLHYRFRELFSAFQERSDEHGSHIPGIIIRTK